MKASSIELNSDYLDFLVQAGIVQIYYRDGEEHVSMRVPLSAIIKRAIEYGFLGNGNDGKDEIYRIASALAAAVLVERNPFYSKDELMGVASVFRCIISDLLYQIAQKANTL